MFIKEKEGKINELQTPLRDRSGIKRLTTVEGLTSEVRFLQVDLMNKKNEIKELTDKLEEQENENQEVIKI